MKRKNKLTVLLSAWGFLSALGLSSVSQAAAVVPMTLQQLVQSSGENSLWIDGEVKSVEVGKNERGWTFSTVTIEGSVLKAPPAGYQHAKLGEWVKPGKEIQTVKVMMFGAPNRAVIKGIDPVPAVGTKGIQCWLGESKTTGFSSPCGSEQQGIFKDTVVDGKAYVANGLGKQVLGLQQLALRSSNEALQTSLKALQASSGDLPKEEFKGVLQGLLDQEFPASK